MPGDVAGKRHKTRYSKWGADEPGGCVCLAAGLIILGIIAVMIWLWLGLER